MEEIEILLIRYLILVLFGLRGAVAFADDLIKLIDKLKGRSR